MIISVSDLHLGDPVSNRSGFISFIEEFLKPTCDEITDLVLLGDILDLWRRNSTSVILANLDILNDICSFGFTVHYIVGNHDFIMREFSQFSDHINLPEDFAGNPKNMIVSDNLLLSDGGESYRFIHGHQINYWYALPFYEAFSRAMCEVNEDVEELSNVWAILQKYPRDLSPFISEKILKLSDEGKNKIERKLAGPLIGHSTTIEESMIEDYHLLQDFTGFRGTKSNLRESIHKEVLALTLESEYLQDIESLCELGKINSESSVEEFTSTFLNAWIDTFQWLHTNRDEPEKKELRALSRQIQRIAVMFSTDLQHNEFLIHGHGHNTYVDHTNRMADTGCWIDNKASFISIDDGKVESVLWPKR